MFELAHNNADVVGGVNVGALALSGECVVVGMCELGGGTGVRLLLRVEGNAPVGVNES